MCKIKSLFLQELGWNRDYDFYSSSLSVEKKLKETGFFSYFNFILNKYVSTKTPKTEEKKEEEEE